MSNVHINDYIAGDSRRFDITIHDENGQPLDISGAAVTWVIGILSKTPAILLTKTVGDGILVMNATGGLIQVRLATNEFLKVGTFQHELEVVLPSGDSYTVASGQFVSRQALLVPVPPAPPP